MFGGVFCWRLEKTVGNAVLGVPAAGGGKRAKKGRLLRAALAGVRDYLAQRYRKVTTWARLQMELTPKVVALMPLVMPFSAAHRTAL